MDEKAIKIVAEWAKSEPLVVKAYIFGSRARADYRDDSDIDIAVELEKRPCDENVLTTWFSEKERLSKGLSQLLSYKLQLELLSEEETPTVLSGIKMSSILVYEKGKNKVVDQER